MRQSIEAINKPERGNSRYDDGIQGHDSGRPKSGCETSSEDEGLEVDEARYTPAKL
jgi:hypothetical protein